MLKNQKGFHILPLLLVIVVIGVVVFTGLKVIKRSDNTPNPDRRGQNYKDLAKCSKEPLTALPMDLLRVEQIAPLGGISTPDHTLPTDHMYIMYPYGESDQKQVFAPADIVITGVSYAADHLNGVLRTADYSISFYACQELKITFSHMDALSDKLKAGIGSDLTTDPGCQTTNQGENHQIVRCEKEVDIKMSAGELVATSNGWDLWATYEGAKSPQVTSPEYYHNVDAVCPLDYFRSDLKERLYKLVRRDAEPRCGEAYQDKADSLQGGWFAHKDPNQAKSDWSSHFSLTHHSQEPKIGMVAVAGTISNHFIYRFTPRSSGVVNREPSQTTAGTLYCYQHEGPARTPNGVIAGTGKVLLELIDNHQMQIERKEGACVENESFTSPTTYYR